jgi:hypothetical protein
VGAGAGDSGGATVSVSGGAGGWPRSMGRPVTSRGRSLGGAADGGAEFGRIGMPTARRGAATAGAGVGPGVCGGAIVGFEAGSMGRGFEAPTIRYPLTAAKAPTASVPRRIEAHRRLRLLATYDD